MGVGKPLFFQAGKRQQFCCVFVLTLLVYPTEHTRAQQFYFKPVIVEKGLSYNPVTVISQDALGLLWVGSSENGLYRYDGHEFVNYSPSPAEGSIQDSFIKNLIPTPDGALWVVTEKNGISVFTFPADSFRRVPFEGRELPPLLSAVARGTDGTMWAASSQEGLFKLPPGSTFFNSFVPEAGPEPCEAYGIAALPDGRVVVGGLGGVFELESGRSRFVPIKGHYQKQVRQIMPLDRDRLWLGMKSQGVFLLNTATGELERHIDFTRWTHQLESNDISQIATDSKGRCWVLTSYGTFVFPNARMEESQAMLLPSRGGNPGEVGEHTANCMFEDRSGTIWHGNSARLDKLENNWPKFGLFRNRHNLPDANHYMGIYHDQQAGKTWAGGRWGMLVEIDRPGNTAAEYMLAKDIGLPNVAIHSIYPLNSDTLLVGTDKGLVFFDRKTKKPSLSKAFKTLFPAYTRVRAIAKSRLGQIMIGTDKGMVVLDAASGAMAGHRLSEQLGFSDAIHDNIKSLYVDRNDTVWVGTNRGLSLFLANEKRFVWQKHLTPYTTSHENLIMGVLRNGDRLYLSSYNNGIYVLDLSERDGNGFPAGSAGRITRNDGLSNNVVYAVLPAKDGTLWAATNKGLSNFHPEKLDFINYYVEDGLQDNEFNLGAHYVSPSGEIFLGGINGINYFDPAKLAKDLFPPTPFIRKMEVLNKVPANRKEAANRLLLGRQDVSLAYDENFVEISFSSDHYANPGKNTYFVMLEGLETDWRANGTQNSVIYANLSPGEYWFKVKAVNPDGFGGQAEARLRITVKAPFWRQLWFYPALLAATVVFFLTWHFWRLAGQRRAKAQLEAEVKKRTQEIAKQKALIEQQHADLSAYALEVQKNNRHKDLVLSLLSHDLRAPLNSIYSFTEVLPSLLENGANEETIRISSKLRGATDGAMHLIDSLLNWAKAEQGNFDYNPGPVVLDEIVDKTLALHAYPAEKKKISLQAQAALETTVFADYQMVFAVVRNLVSNAIKFTDRKGQVTVSVRTEGNNAILAVADNGKGMPQETRDNILQGRPVFSSEGTYGEKGMGIGLALSKLFIEKNGGGFNIESELGKGTVFSVSLNLLPEAGKQYEETEALVHGSK